MISSDYERFVKIMQGLAKLFSKKLDDEQIARYWDALKDRHIDDIDRRASDYTRQGKFFPRPYNLRPAEIVREVAPVNAAADAEFRAAVERSNRSWDEVIAKEGPVGKLKFAACLMARYEVTLDPRSEEFTEKTEWLKGRAAELLRESDASVVLKSLHVWSFVLQLFGMRGIERLEQRAAGHTLEHSA